MHLKSNSKSKDRRIVKFNNFLAKNKNYRYLLKGYLNELRFYKTPSDIPQSGQMVLYQTPSNKPQNNQIFLYQNPKEQNIQYERPMIFFPKRPDPQEVVNSFPKIDQIHKLQFKLICTWNLNQKLETLRELENLIYELREYYLSKIGRSLWYMGPGPFSKDIEEVKEKIKRVLIQTNPEAAKFYHRIVKMSEDEEVNGYNLYDVADNIMNYETYLELLEIWNDKTEYTYEEFMEKYDNEACSDWCKKDRHGKCYGGYWRYPEGSYEKEHAWELSRKDNGQGLWELLNPHNFIFQTIKIGCNNRRESVRYSNFLGEWMTRKMQLMKEEVKSLKDICITYVKKSNMEISNLPADVIDDVHSFVI